MTLQPEAVEAAARAISDAMMPGAPERTKELAWKEHREVRMIAARAALTAAAPLMAKWRPIEEAPRSGVALLLYQPWTSGRETICIGHYANGWVNQLCLFCARDQEEKFGGEIGNEVSHCDPTHFMPLPPPPQEGETG